MTPEQAWDKRYAPLKFANAAKHIQQDWLAAWTIARVRDRLRVLGAARAAEPDLLAALHEAYRPLDRTQEWTPEHSRVYPKKAATIINAARLLSLAASQTPPTGTSQGEGTS